MARKFVTVATATSTLMLAACMGSSAGGTQSASSQSASSNAPQQVKSITAEEKKLGDQYHPQLVAQYGGSFDAPQAAYVETVGKNIAVQSGLGNARSDFTVTLLNSPVNNAFAIPGGYIYVTRQLLALMNDEAELAGVLGHEVGHVAARHSQKRQKRAQRNSIIGAIGQIASAVLLGNSSAGRLGQQLFGTGSQLLTLKYSRDQETEADDLGIRYLNSAGYDPKALSSMLASLAAQSSIDARVSGREARNVPAWASTHPDPAKRVSRALQRAGADSSGVRNREVFLNRIDGVLYGDDPEQGVVEGTTFLHPDMRFTFTAPTGFGLQNTTTAVGISGQSGQGQLTLLPYSGNLRSYVDSAFKKVGGDKTQLNYGNIQSTTVNGLPAAYSTARVNNGQQQVDVTVFAYEFSKTRALHFVTITPAGRGQTFNGMYASMRRLSANEAAQIKPRKLDVVTVKSGDTIAGFARRMAYSQLQTERFLALNGLSHNAQLRAGQRVKIVTY